MWKQQGRSMSAQVESKKRALEGVRVLDLSNVLAGPFCATVLGEFGADVIKVELPGKGDTMRSFGTMTATGATLNWLSEARNKRCITLDLRKPAGLAIAKRLVAQSDIVVENFTTGTLEGWGLGYEDMKKVNPEVILVRITAYGQTGPYKDRPGFARIAHGFAGLAHLAGEPDGPPVIPGSTSLADYISGLYGALGALLAYIGRQRHGGGQYVDIGLYEGVFRMLDEMAAAFAKSGYVRQRMGADTVNVVPHSHYRTRDDKWIALACTNDRMWQRLCKAMDRLDLLGPDKYATMAQRLAERERVNGIVGAFVASMDRDALLEHCRQHEVPAGPINTIADIFEDPQFAARQNLVEIFDPREGRVVVPNVLPKLSETPGELKWLGPDMGQHNDEIYRGRLGLSAEEVERLKSEGII
jgi:crotonobetainyl-CoA:carnitine CoA-transferase CaiB-like acyl-CoA transferase